MQDLLGSSASMSLVRVTRRRASTGALAATPANVVSSPARAPRVSMAPHVPHKLPNLLVYRLLVNEVLSDKLISFLFSHLCFISHTQFIL